MKNLPDTMKLCSLQNVREAFQEQKLLSIPLLQETLRKQRKRLNEASINNEASPLFTPVSSGKELEKQEAAEVDKTVAMNPIG